MAGSDRYTYREEWSQEDGACLARCLEFPSLMTHGPNPDAALSEMRRLVADVLKDLKRSGETVPEPLGLRSYSGKLILRLPRNVHKEASIRAAEEGVSLNQCLLSRLS